jgi:peroxidase
MGLLKNKKIIKFHFVNKKGNNVEKNSKLRTFSDGMLKSSKLDKIERECLPYDLAGECPNIKRGRPCFNTGDIRSNQNYLLLSFHLLFLREHNRIASLLPQVSPLKYNTDEAIFEEARRINIAQYQHIIYEQFLPELIGQNAFDLYELRPSSSSSSSYFMNYNSELYPSISIEFSTAAFRFGHSLVRDSLSYITNGDITKEKYLNEVNIRKVVFNTMGTLNDGGLDSWLHASLMQSASWFDPSLNEYLNDHLFEEFNRNATSTRRFSLAALNINRGRDHGLQGYNAYRTLCGQEYARDFDELTNIPVEVRKKLRKYYKSVDDIDLFTGGLSELPIKDGVVGVTFACNIHFFLLLFCVD